MNATNAALLLAGCATGVFLLARFRLLTFAGAVLAGVMALLLAAAGGFGWLAPALAFLLPASLWTRWPGGSRRTDWTRTVSQVLANGGVAVLAAVIAVLFRDPELGGLLLSGAFAAAAADTWSTEWGRAFGGAPLSLRTFRRVESGRSGAISAAGLLASLAGGASVAIAAGLAGVVDSGRIYAILWAGVIGGFADSLAGAWVQGIWRSAEGRFHETPRDAGPGATLVRGAAWIRNDAVNAFATVVGASAACILSG